MTKKILNFLFVTVLAVAFAACSDSKSEIRDAAEEANKECPINMGYGMSVESIQFDGDNIVFTYDLGNMLSAADLESQKDVMKNAMLTEVKGSSDADINKLVEACRKAGAGMDFIFTDADGGSCKVHIAAEELN